MLKVKLVKSSSENIHKLCLVERKLKLFCFFATNIFRINPRCCSLQPSTRSEVKSCVDFVSSSLFLCAVNRLCPRRGRFALSDALAAHLHPCAAPASSGLLLVRLAIFKAAHTNKHLCGKKRASLAPFIYCVLSQSVMSAPI